MTAHGIARALVQLRKAIGLGENGFADSAGNEAALRRLFDDKHDLAHCAIWYTPSSHDRRGPQETDADFWHLECRRDLSRRALARILRRRPRAPRPRRRGGALRARRLLA